jgi:hypothetical protein
MMKQFVIATWGVGGAFESDYPGKFVLVFGGDFERDCATHRTTQDDWSFEPEREPYRSDHFQI